MTSATQRFFTVLAICAAASLLLAAFQGRDLAALINLGSYVGAASLLLGAWRLQSGNDALEQASEMQLFQNMADAAAGHRPRHAELIGAALSAGPLFFAGLTWLVALQTVRYAFGITL